MDDSRNTLRQRGVSRSVVFAALAVILVVAGVFVWVKVGDHVDREADAAAAQCVEGRTVVGILADPDITPGLTEIATQYMKTNPVIRDHCIRIAVHAADAKITYTGLTGSWDTASMGIYPAAWVPQSSVWAAELATRAPTAVDGTPSSLVTSPVVLATSPQLATAVGDRLDWGQLPTLQQRDDSLNTFGLRGWGGLKLAMPRDAQSDATALAAQAVAMQVTRTTDTLTAADARSPRVPSSVAALTDDAPRVADGTPSGVASAIAGAADAARAPAHAVPITEQRLYQLTKEDTTARLAEVIPQGPTPIADYPVIHLTGKDVSEVAATAVDDFFTFAAKPEHLRALTQLGFRGDAEMPGKTSTVTFPVTNNPMPNPEPAAIISINRLVFGPVSG